MSEPVVLSTSADETTAAPTNARLRLTATVLPSLSGQKDTASVHVRVADAAEDDPHTRRLLVLCLDTSGSMGANAAEIEGSYLSRLQLAQICIQLSLKALGPQDDVCVVAFSQAPVLALEITPMTNAGKAKAAAVVNALKADRTTDIRGALLMALDQVKGADAAASAEKMREDLEAELNKPAGSGSAQPAVRAAGSSRRRRDDPADDGGDDDDDNGDPGVLAGAAGDATPASSAGSAAGVVNAALASFIASTDPSKAKYGVVRIGLFTDGYPEPSIAPDSRSALLKMLAHAETNNAVLSTFGFGTQIATDLLVQLSEAGGGSFAHISDSSMALTTFVNFIASFKSTASAGKVRLSANGGSDDFVQIRKPVGFTPPQPSYLSHAAAAAYAKAVGGATFKAEKSMHVDLGAVQKGRDQPRSLLFDVALNPSRPGRLADTTEALTITADAFGCGGRNNKPFKASLTLTAGQLIAAARGETITTVISDAASSPEAVSIDITSPGQLFDIEAEVTRLRGVYVDTIRAVTKEATVQLHRGEAKDDSLLRPCREKIQALIKESLEVPFPVPLQHHSLHSSTAAAAVEEARLAASAAVAMDPRVLALAHNIYDDDEPERGQVGMALQKNEWCEKWGLSYLNAFLLAHARQTCTNFKDVSLQDYSSATFKQEKEGLETTMSSLLVELVGEALKANRSDLALMAGSGGAGGYGSSYASSYAGGLSASAVSSLYDARGGCFSGDSLVTVVTSPASADVETAEQRETVPISALREGMTVMATGIDVPASFPMKVKAVLVRRAAAKPTFIKLSEGLKITPWHPVFVPSLTTGISTGQWRFPSDLADAGVDGAERIEVEGSADLFNVVLEEPRTSILVGGLACAALGHGITTASLSSLPSASAKALTALAHHYYGDRQRVLEDVAKIREGAAAGGSAGVVEVKAEVRDAATNRVVGMI